jgi:hypothetical protein
MDTVQTIANIATTIAVILLAWQVWLARHALKAQARANELEAFSTMNMKFLDIMERFDEHINDPNTKEEDLSPEERRAIDRYFYLANMEYILYKEKVIDDKLSAQWIRGIKSAANRKPFVERWNSTASKFTLDEEFRSFFVKNIDSD